MSHSVSPGRSRSGSAPEVPALGDADVHIWVVPLDHPDHQCRRELANAAQRRLLAAYTRVAPDALEVSREPRGKPVLDDGSLQFNLSHSGELALVAITRCSPVGVDLEHQRELHDPSALARRICTPAEREHLLSSPDADALLRLWVRKEAVIKATGEGLARPLNELDVLEQRVADAWSCLDLALGNSSYRAAVAVGHEPAVTTVVSLFCQSIPKAL
jgi:4'-phosphopantetheinyl transferase